MHLQPVDWAIVAIYAVLVVTIGMRAARRAATSEGYFLANRQLRWPFIGASLLASNISAEHFVGLAGTGFAIGMCIGGFEWIAVFCLVPLIVLFLPFYMRNRIYTVPEFLEKRFSTRVRLLFSALMIVLSILTKISISLWASSIVFSDVLGWDRVTVIWVLGLFTALYTMKGGLTAVVYTDALQTTILLAAAVVLTSIGLGRVGGWQGLHARLPAEMFSMVRPPTHADVPWPGMFFGGFLVGSFYWSMDQVLVQRVFAARDLNQGRLGAVFCGYLKVAMPFLLVMPGLIARALFPHLSSPDKAYPALLGALMPAGLLGLTVAGIAAALMGHLSATYNSIATLFTRDFYLRWKPDASQPSQVFTGRMAVLAVFVLGALWAPVIGRFESLWIYLQTVTAYLVMPFVGIFFLGVLWKRITTRGVMASIVTGFVAGPLLMFDSRHPFIPFLQAPVLRPWLHGAIIECALCVVALVGVSLLDERRPAGDLVMTTVDWGKTPSAEARPSLLADYRFWLTLLVTLTAYLWWRMR